ncbi:hypothetical protein [Candidatus Poriferisodalis sp.]|uniref:hypothetical protein n=1 Tax=Candidatus Poriferisodalis sp. TaxID=3101277 RepID=UPI003B0141B1
MPEDDRSRFYDWLCDHDDGRLVEYVMSRLLPAALSELVTKSDLDVAISRLKVEMAEQRDADRKAAAGQREADRKEMADQRVAARKEFSARLDQQDEKFSAKLEQQDQRVTAQLDGLRKEARDRHRLLVGVAVFLALEIAAVQAGWLQRGLDVLSAAF